MIRWLPLLLCASCAVTTLVGYRVSPDHPREDREETLDLAGLSAPASVLFDDLGVPHIRAGNDRDLARTVGYVHGRMRFFEMDMMRRLAEGRLAELVGDNPILDSTTVHLDVAMRGWGFGRLAVDDVAQADADTRALLEAYAAGVNAAIARQTPLEHRLLGAVPAPWTPADSMAVGRLNAWTVSHNWQQETARLLLALQVGIDRAEQLYPAEPLDGASLPGDGQRRELPPSVAPELRAMFPAKAPGPTRSQPVAHVRTADGFGGASNAWVVGGARSRSGKPLLANDPHLSHLVPSIVFQQHIHVPAQGNQPELDAIGVTVPGLPYLLAGRNNHVAWGMTSTVGDAIDLVIERPTGRDAVLGVDGQPQPMQTEAFEVQVHAGSTHQAHVRRTSNGPLLNDLYPELLPADAPLVALRWRTEGAAQTITALGQANRARTVAELRTSLGGMVTPVQTWTVADAAGQVGLFASGRVPVRTKHRGTFPVPGWLADYQWRGMAEAAQMPAGVAGDDGLFVHANNLMVDPRTAAVSVGVDSAPAYRADRIRQLIAAADKHGVDSFRQMQCDVQLPRARRLVPHLVRDLEGWDEASETELLALRLLRAWDFEAPPDSAAAAVFFSTYREAVTAGLQDELEPRALAFVLSQRYSTNVADGWLATPDHPVWDDRRTAGIETRAGVVRQAFRRAVAALVAGQGSEPARWRWGKLHDVAPRHPFGGKSALAGLVNLPESEAGGGLDSVWKSHFDLGHPRTPFRAMAGPVLRMVVDLADSTHGQWIIDTGASGWPKSPHYGDQHGPWRRCELRPMVSAWPELERTAAGRLTLQPSR